MNEAAEVEVLLRVVDLDLGEVVIVTTFLDGRFHKRELYNPHGELLQVRA